ncbi:hypothetical protein SM114_02865 [Erwinia pyrifoliae]|uniref:hypothetical protein n=1 Tax=Erwinia pyrifoliae TaxID=79967 RepID=UPI0034D972C4
MLAHCGWSCACCEPLFTLSDYRYSRNRDLVESSPVVRSRRQPPFVGAKRSPFGIDVSQATQLWMQINSGTSVRSLRQPHDRLA